MATPAVDRLIMPALSCEICPDTIIPCSMKFFYIEGWFDTNLEQHRELNAVQAPLLQMRDCLRRVDLIIGNNHNLERECYEATCLYNYQRVL